MKITLHMIANQLKDSDIFLHIHEEKNLCYRSSRTFRSAGNIYVSQVEEDTYIYGRYPDSYILFRNAREEYVQNKVLDIFDAYADWMDALKLALEQGNWQSAINICFEMFGNPIFILNPNGKVVAITDQVEKEQLKNPEWEHLLTYGYSSYQNYQKFQAPISRQAAIPSSEALFFKNPPTSDRTEFMISIVCDARRAYGRITVMGYFRKLTDGDSYLLEYVSKTLLRYMGSSDKKAQQLDGSSILLDLFLNNTLSDNARQQLRQYYSWKENEEYRVCAIEIPGTIGNLPELMKDYLENLFSNCPTFQYEHHIVVIVSGELIDTTVLFDRMAHSCIQEWNVKVGISLEFRELAKAAEFYRQAVYAISKMPDRERIAFFYDYALDFLLSTDSADNRLLAIHPDIAEWSRREGGTSSDNMMTLYTYLLHERSLNKAAAAMYVHRNTLFYRIGKIMEKMRYTLEDPYTRQYVLTSIVVARNSL